MDEEIESLLVRVRADTTAFAHDVADMRAQLDGPLADGMERVGRVIDNALARAVRNGKLGFEDLKKIALSAMAEIAASAIRNGIGALGGSGSLLGSAASLLAGLLGAPRRATGGPASPGRAYLVGERGPELFVPTASGRVETGAPAGARDVRLSITINAAEGSEARALRQSSRQVAHAIRQALARVGD